MHGEYTKQTLLYRDSKIVNAYILFNLSRKNATSEPYYYSTSYSLYYAVYSRQ